MDHLPDAPQGSLDFSRTRPVVTPLSEAGGTTESPSLPMRYLAIPIGDHPTDIVHLGH